MSAKVCRNFFLDLLKKETLTTVPIILIPEHAQSNATFLGGFTLKIGKCS